MSRSHISSLANEPDVDVNVKLNRTLRKAWVLWVGMVQGLIHDIPTCQQLIDRIIAEADAIVDQRLATMRR